MLSPLFPLPTRWAWLVWNLGGAWLAAWAVRRAAGPERRLLTLSRLALISPNALYCLVLGQTALLTTGVLAALLLTAPGRRAALAGAACVLALGIKPPLAVVAAAALLAAGLWSTLALAAAGSAAVIAAAVVWWGNGVVGDYVTLVGRYNLVQADPLFRAGFVPGLMSNLRNVLLHTGWLDDARASAVSSLVFLVALAAPALLAVATQRRLRLDVALACTATSYALFAPHLSSTEDLILLVVLLALWRAGEIPKRLHLAYAALCVVPQFFGGSVAVVFGSGPGGAAAELLPLVAFALKLALGGLLATRLWSRHGRP
jgi:hypothetical protein